MLAQCGLVCFLLISFGHLQSQLKNIHATALFTCKLFLAFIIFRDKLRYTKFILDRVPLILLTPSHRQKVISSSLLHHSIISSDAWKDKQLPSPSISSPLFIITQIRGKVLSCFDLSASFAKGDFPNRYCQLSIHALYNPISNAFLELYEDMVLSVASMLSSSANT